MTSSRNLWRVGIELTAASFVVLFQELALIRWMSGEVRVLAYFPNVILISAFLGLGIGSLRAGKRSLLWTWPLALAVTTIAVLGMSRIAFTSNSPSESLWLLYYDIPKALVINDVRPPIIIAFILGALAFVGLGQFVGERLREFTASSSTLWGYVADLSGSLLGVIGFAIASFAHSFPVIWFLAFLLAGFLIIPRRLFLAYAGTAVAIVIAIHSFETADYYSPYYALRATHANNGGMGVSVLANGSLHQYAAPLAANDIRTSAYDQSIAAGYPIPYASLGRAPRHVLVLGAGTGNDVATALERGAQDVDAVEIDPVILQLGHTVHPDHPYSSPKVHTYNTDARAFLRNSTKHYDLIVFGTLDSMTRLSALSNVRLDNFVYTVDCLKAARSRLTPDGGVALYFMVSQRAIFLKLVAMLNEAFGEPPLSRIEGHALFNTILIAGPAWKHLRTPQLEAISAAHVEAARYEALPTDDWPFLYLAGRTPPAFYFWMIAAFLLISGAGLAIASPELRNKGLAAFDGEMFFYGAAFLLLETKLVTQMNLVWGTTWVTSAVVFGSILTTILLGTIAMQQKALPFSIAVGGVTAALIATYVIPGDWLLLRSIPARLAASLAFAGVPILFASLCFAISFRSRSDSNIAFGWNLAGAVVGGLMDSLSMSIGIGAMTLVALILYLLAFLVRGRKRAEVEALHESVQLS